jgi:hypothetical protein
VTDNFNFLDKFYISHNCVTKSEIFRKKKLSIKGHKTRHKKRLSVSITYLLCLLFFVIFVVNPLHKNLSPTLKASSQQVQYA